MNRERERVREKEKEREGGKERTSQPIMREILIPARNCVSSTRTKVGPNSWEPSLNCCTRLNNDLQDHQRENFECFQNGTKKPEILELMANLKFTPNMQRLLEEAVDNLEATIIIISDSNSEFIHHILKEYKLSERVDKVFTNPARWTEEGKLEIGPYHHQETCKLSTENLCKGQILEDYISESKKEFSFVCYVGDGRNDFCPSLRLSENDLTCVRQGFSLEKYIPQMEQKGFKVKAEKLFWNDADQILARLKEKLGS